MSATGDSPQLSQSIVFKGGTEGYHIFRIPSLITTAAGTVLAFCEGRRNDRSDHGDIDLLLKRSFDGGRTWGEMQVVATAGSHKVGNQAPVVDASTGTIWLPMLHQIGSAEEQAQHGRDGVGNIEVWVTKSTDDGATWAEPVDITSQVKDPRADFIIIGPGISTQLSSGRLLIPSYFKTGWGEKTFTNAMWSDDHGQTWQHGEVCTEGGNECQAVELSDGRVMLNMRNHRGEKEGRRRLVAISEDGGATWGEAYLDDTLIEPTCQGSILRGEAGILFSNPAAEGRTNLTVRLSHDEGQTWAHSRELNEGRSGYSCLTNLESGVIGCLYENGAEHYTEQLSFARFGLEWLTNGN